MMDETSPSSDVIGTGARLPSAALLRSGRRLLQKLARKLLRVRPEETVMSHGHLAPARYVFGGLRRAKHLLPTSALERLRRKFLIGPDESFLRGFYKVYTRRARLAQACQPIVNHAWQADHPLISVIIPCYNYGHYVHETIASIFASTWQDLEILLIEGGSTDGTTPDVVRSLEGGRIRCFYQSRRCSESENRLLGLQHVRGKYVLFLDADDLIDPTYIENAIYLLETTGVDMIVPDIRPFSSPEELQKALSARQGEAWRTEGIPVPKIFRQNYATVASIFRYSFWKEHDLGVCPLSITYAQDWYLWMRFASFGARYLHLSEAHHLYRVHAASISLNSDADTRNKAIAILQKEFEPILNDWDRVENAIARQAHIPEVQNSAINLGRLSAAPKRGTMNVMVCIPWFDQGGSTVLLGNVSAELAKHDVAITAVATNPETDPHLTRGASNFLAHTKDCFSLATCLPRGNKAEFLSYLVRSRQIDVVLIAGSQLTYEALEDLRRENPQLRVVDHLYNKEGHVGSNRKFTSLIDFNIVASDEVKEELISRGEQVDRIEVIAHGVDTDAFKPARPTGPGARNGRPLTFGFLGRLSEEKRPEFVVKMAQQFPQFRFLISGDGPLRPQITDAIARCGFHQEIRYTGFVETPHQFYDSVDAVLIPSRVEGLPIVLLEALALGKPVIASRVGMIGQVIENGVNGFTFESGDLKELAQCIEKVATLDDEQWNLLSRRARDTAERRHSLAQCAKKYLSIFERLKATRRTSISSPRSIKAA